MSIKRASALQVFLTKLDRFHGLSDTDRAKLERLPLHRAVIASGQDIVPVIGQTDRCSIILEGMAFSYKVTRLGQRQLLNLHLAGDLPDLQNLYLGKTDVGVAAASRCCVGYVPHAALNDLCSRRPGLMKALWRETLLDAAIGCEWLLNVGRRAALARLSHLLCETVVRHRSAGLTSDYSCSFPLTQTALADALGLSTVHVNRALQKLRREHLVELKERRLMVLDWERLCEIAEFNSAYLYLERRPPNVDKTPPPTSPSSAGSAPTPARPRSASPAA